MPKSRRMSSGPQPEHMTKSRVVEDIVALIHEGEGVTVVQNVLLPTLSDPTQTREIDILVTGNVSGYSIRLPIECKNYSNRISAGQIDEFKGRVEDVGLSPRNAIYVCVSGYSRDAGRRARDYGIKLFTLEGLTEDRLSSEVYQAFMSNVFFFLQVERVKMITGDDDIDDSVWRVLFTKREGES